VTAYGKEENPGKNNVSANLFVFYLSIYLLTASGLNILQTDVSTSRYEITKAVVERFDLAISPGTGLGIQGVDGREYTQFGIGSVLVVLPFFIFGKLTGIPPENLLSIINQFLGAASAVVVYLFALALGYSKRSSMYASICYGLGTFAWFYSKDPGDHALETFTVLSAAYFMYRYCGTKKKSYLSISAAFTGLAFITRPTSLLIVPPLMILLFLSGSRRIILRESVLPIMRDSARFFLMMLPFVALFFWYNYLRFGSIFETGYTIMAKQHNMDLFRNVPFLTGLSGLLVSPGKGFFYYSPVAVLFFFSVPSFMKKNPVPASCFIMVILAYLFFYSNYVFWHGVNGWGPRFIIVTTPFMLISVAALFDSDRWKRSSLIRGAVASLFAMSIMIQVAAVSVHPERYLAYLLFEKKIRFMSIQGRGVPAINGPPAATNFDWRLSPITAQIRFMFEIGNELTTSSGHTSADVYGKVTLPLWLKVYDFWWLYKYYLEQKTAGFLAAAALLLSALASGLRLLKQGP